MTPEQYERWKDFALRMARTCFKRRRAPSPKEIVAQVQEFFDDLEGCNRAVPIECIVDWDHSEPYPEGHPYRSIKYHYDCGCIRAAYSAPRNPPKPDCEHCGGSGRVPSYSSPPSVGDLISESYRESWIPYYWSIPDEKIEAKEEQWMGPARCCIRAGLDLAVSPSAGVMGFTVGDVRRMYPEGVPDWVKGEPIWETVPIVGTIPGVGFIPGEAHSPKSFDDLKDDESIWL